MCTISIALTPAATGSRSAAVRISDNASTSPQVVALSGTGTSDSLGLGIAGGGSSSATVAAGNPACYMLSIGRVGSSATLNCGGAPKGAYCSVASMVGVSATTASTFAVNVTTTSRTLANSRLDTSVSPMCWALGMFGFLVLPNAGRKARKAVGLLPLVLLLLICSCGGFSGPRSNPNGTPVGTYPLTLTATSGLTSQSGSSNFERAITTFAVPGVPTAAGRVVRRLVTSGRKSTWLPIRSS